MGEIRLPGLSTGIDTTALIQQLMAVNGRRLASYQVRKSELEEKTSAIDEIRALVKTFDSAVSSIADTSKLNLLNAVSSDTDYLDVSATSSATPGSHSVEINQLAQSETWVQDSSSFSYATDYVGGGSFIYTYNNQQRVISTVANQTTLEELVGLINNDSENPGVNASILFQDGKQHLMLSGSQTGTDYAITIDSSNTELLQAQTTFTDDGENAQLSDKIIDLDQFSGTLGATDKIVIEGKNRDNKKISKVELTITENTTVEHIIDSINVAFEGIATARYDKGTIYLVDNEPGDSDISIDLSFQADGLGTAELTLPAFEVTTEGGSVSADIASLSPATFVKTQSAQDSQIKVDGYPIGDTEWIERNSNSINDVINGITFNLIDLPETDRTIKVTINRDNEAVKTKVEELVSAYNELMDAIDSKTDFNAESKKMGLLSSDPAVSFIKTRLRDPLLGAITGFSSANDAYASASDIGISLDGAGRIDFDSEKFNDAMADDFMSLVKFLGAVGDGASSSSSVNFYGATKYTQAGQYNVRIASDASGNATGAWIKLDTEDWSEAREATIDGNLIKASMDFSGTDPEMGLQLVFQWQNDGSHSYDPSQPEAGNPVEAAISVRHGMGSSFAGILDEILDVGTGRLDMDDEIMQDKIDNVSDHIESETKRLDRIEARLIAKYARLEKTLSLLQQQFGAFMGM